MSSDGQIAPTIAQINSIINDASAERGVGPHEIVLAAITDPQWIATTINNALSHNCDDIVDFAVQLGANIQSSSVGETRSPGGTIARFVLGMTMIKANIECGVSNKQIEDMIADELRNREGGDPAPGPSEGFLQVSSSLWGTLRFRGGITEQWDEQTGTWQPYTGESPAVLIARSLKNKELEKK